MSTPLKFMELSGPQVAIRADLRSGSSLDVHLVVRRSGAIKRPVDVASTLKRFGLGLAEAHAVLNRIVADEPVELSLGNADRETMIAQLAELGVEAR